MSEIDDNLERRRRHTAGAFDIRNVIGALLGLYGIVLTILGVVSDDSAAKTGDLDANLWAGLALLAVSAGFIVWARVRPLVVDEEAVAERRTEDGPPPGH